MSDQAHYMNFSATYAAGLRNGQHVAVSERHKLRLVIYMVTRPEKFGVPSSASL